MELRRLPFLFESLFPLKSPRPSELRRDDFCGFCAVADGKLESEYLRPSPLLLPFTVSRGAEKLFSSSSDIKVGTELVRVRTFMSGGWSKLVMSPYLALAQASRMHDE